MDYDTLVASKTTDGSLQQWINRSTTPPTVILEEAQALIYNKLLHWRMKSEATGSMVVGTPTINLPSDFIEAKRLRITGIYNSRIRKGDESFVQDRYQYDGSGVRVNQIPEWFYISGTKIYFDNPPDIAYSYLLPYYATPAALSSLNPTNFLTNDNPRLLRVACMLVAVEFEKEVGQGVYDRNYWQAQLDKLIMEYQAASDIEQAPWDVGAEFP